MESGFVDYKICDRDFDCENCPFDQAIHDQSGLHKFQIAKDAQEENILLKKFDTKRVVPSDLLISNNHVWIKKIEEAAFYVGIDHLAQSLIKRISTFQFPFVGSQITKGEPIIWVIGKWGIVSIPSPVNCEILEFNSDLLLNPNKFFYDDIYSVWLLKITVADKINSIDFSNGMRFKDLLAQDLLTIKAFSKKLISNPALGVTMFDGGELLMDLNDHLSNKKYVQLLKLIFNKK